MFTAQKVGLLYCLCVEAAGKAHLSLGIKSVIHFQNPHS